MLPANIKWYFPESLAEMEAYLKQSGVILHAGGTRILKTQTKNIKGLIDIGGLGLNYIKREGKIFSIGAGTTFGEVVEYSRKHKKFAILGKALSEAAATPLRNRITIGGSLKDFPIWSSLYAPLVALNAKIEIYANSNLFIFPIEDYIVSPIQKRKYLITQILIEEKKNILWDVKRFSFLHFEYPLFTIAVVFTINKKVIEDTRIVITGVKQRLKRFEEAENVFTGSALNIELVDKAIKLIRPEFISDYKYSDKYKANVSTVYIKDILEKLCGGAK